MPAERGQIQVLHNLFVRPARLQEPSQHAALVANLGIQGLSPDQVKQLGQAGRLLARAGGILPAGPVEDSEEIRIHDRIRKLYRALPRIEIRKALRHLRHLGNCVQ